MRFRVYRANTGPGKPDMKPCDDAVWGNFLYTEKRRGVGFPDEYSWYGFGINHREEDGGVARELEMEEWFVNLSDFYDLDGFMEKVGFPVEIRLEPESYGFSHTIIIKDDVL